MEIVSYHVRQQRYSVVYNQVYQELMDEFLQSKISCTCPPPPPPSPFFCLCACMCSISIQLHGVCDQFTKETNAGVYVNILTAKTKVAHLNKLTIPRLELLSNLLLGNIYVGLRESPMNGSPG